MLGERSSPRSIGRTGTLLGAVEPISVHETTAELRRQETLLLYTDGVIDAGRPHRPLGEHGLIELCARTPPLTLGGLLARIRDEAISRSGGPLRDDVALLALRLRPPGAGGGAVPGAGDCAPALSQIVNRHSRRQVESADGG